jgi:hypothetical protein
MGGVIYDALSALVVFACKAEMSSLYFMLKTEHCGWGPQQQLGFVHTE